MDVITFVQKIMFWSFGFLKVQTLKKPADAQLFQSRNM